MITSPVFTSPGVFARGIWELKGTLRNCIKYKMNGLGGVLLNWIEPQKPGILYINLKVVFGRVSTDIKVPRANKRTTLCYEEP